MKKLFVFAGIVACLASCSIAEMPHDEQPLGKKCYLVADFAGTRTALQSDQTSVWWKPQEEISVFYGTASLGKFISDNTAASASATFESENTISEDLSTGEEFVAIYPFNTKCTYDGAIVTIPLNLKYQIAEMESFADKAFPSVAKGSGPELSFNNICGGIKFQVEMDDVRSVTITAKDPKAVLAADQISFAFKDGKPVVDLASAVNPTNSITLALPSGYSFDTETYYYISALPCDLDGGFTMTFNTSSKQAVLTSSNDLAIKRAIFGNVGMADHGLTYISVDPIDLSESSTANCYLLSEPGTYKFKTVQGNTDTSVGEVAAAEVLWESFGTDETPAEGSLVHSVSYANNYVTFKSNGIPGNAVIAVRNASGVILWSWHIWCSPDPISVMDQEYHNSSNTPVFTLMDRNLGATSSIPGSVGFLGLLYQWGRKDPFLGSSSISEGIRAMSTITWPDPVTSNATVGTIEFATAHPTTFIGGDATTKDWLTGEGKENTRWNRDKGIYDPCPAGYRVPYANGSNYPWRSALDGAQNVTDETVYDATTHCMNLTNIFHTSTPCYYPFAGYGRNANAAFINVGLVGLYWSCAPSSLKVIELYLQSNGKINAWYADGRANLLSVRCMKM